MRRWTRSMYVVAATLVILAAGSAPAWANSGPEFDWYYSPTPEVYLLSGRAALAILFRAGAVVALVAAIALFALWRLARSATPPPLSSPRRPSSQREDAADVG